MTNEPRLKYVIFYSHNDECTKKVGKTQRSTGKRKTYYGSTAKRDKTVHDHNIILFPVRNPSRILQCIHSATELVSIEGYDKPLQLFVEKGQCFNQNNQWLKMRNQLFSSASKTVQGFSNDRKIFNVVIIIALSSRKVCLSFLKL